MYRALNTLAKRKQAFQEYIDEYKIREKINGNTRYRRVCDILGQDPLFLSIEEKARISLFEEWSEEMRKKEKEEQRVKRKEAVDKLKILLKSLPDIKADTPLKEAQEVYKNHPIFQGDETLSTMDPIDILTIYEDHVKILEAEYYEVKAKERAAARRKERQNRDAFRELLKRLQADGVIFFDSKWKDIQQYLKDEPAYHEVLGQPGSTPIELFWDVTVELELQYQVDRKVVMDVMKKYGISVKTDTIFEDFLSELRGSSSRMKNYSDGTIHAVFDEHMLKVAAKMKEEKRRQEKKLKKKMDAFKSLLKRADVPISSSSAWEDVRPLIATKSEFEALEESFKVEVFNKFIRRLKEKEKSSYSESEEEAVGDSDGEEGVVSARKKRKEKDSKERESDKKRHRRSRSPDDFESPDAKYRGKRKHYRSEEDYEGGVDRRASKRDRGYEDWGRDGRGPQRGVPAELRKDMDLNGDDYAPKYVPDDSEEEGEVRG
ncbi:hypothetical protein BC829DRAFT_379467 [Chytridium lagenaria]|nr:hypothetical protein BC829DRAFT_379467 [Chytridium lagenaria]